MAAERRRTGLALLGILAAAVVIGLRSNTDWDYPVDGGPPIDALIHGRIHEFLSARPAMGPFSLVLRAPFAALSLITGQGGPGDAYLYAYRFGVIPCIVIAGLLGLVLARLMRERGRPPLQRGVVIALCTVNPVTLRAIHFGHPEEILAATLAVGAVVAGLRGRALMAGVLLALALATKQWALLGVMPVALALGWSRLRKPLLVVAGIGALVLIPLLLAGADSLVHTNTRLLFDIRNQFVLPASVWWPFTHDLVTSNDSAKHAIPGWLGLIAHPLIPVVGIALALAFARRVRERPLERLMPLTALIFLLRCMLDPVDSSWYHVPFYLAVVAGDALTGRFLSTLAATFLLQLMMVIRAEPALVCAVYLCWTIPFAIYLARRAYGASSESPPLAIGALDHRRARLEPLPETE